MLGIGGVDKSRFTSADQTCLLHHALDSLVIDLPPIAFECFGHATIPIACKIVPQLLQCLHERSITILLHAGTAMLIIPLPVDVEQLTQLAY
jgi:hypothetical protein